MLNMAREIVKAFRSKGIIHKVEGAEINKVRPRVLRRNKQVCEWPQRGGDWAVKGFSSLMLCECEACANTLDCPNFAMINMHLRMVTKELPKKVQKEKQNKTKPKCFTMKIEQK